MRNARHSWLIGGKKVVGVLVGVLVGVIGGCLLEVWVWEGGGRGVLGYARGCINMS